VIEKTRTISGVKQAVSYVKLAGEPLEAKEMPKNLNPEIIDDSQRF
jgi:hypothetical protein